MNTTDFRRGNYVMYNGRIGIIAEILWDTMWLIFNEDDNRAGMTSVTVQMIDPVALTPDILIACGYEITSETDNGSLYQPGLFYLLNGGVRSELALVYRDGKFLRYNEPFTSLHRLQNLFHAVSGMEMQVNL